MNYALGTLTLPTTTMKCVLYSPVVKLIDYYTATSIKVTFVSHQRFDIYFWSSLFLFESYRNREKQEKKDPCDNTELRRGTETTAATKKVFLIFYVKLMNENYTTKVRRHIRYLRYSFGANRSRLPLK